MADEGIRASGWLSRSLMEHRQRSGRRERMHFILCLLPPFKLAVQLSASKEGRLGTAEALAKRLSLKGGTFFGP